MADTITVLVEKYADQEAPTGLFLSKPNLKELAIQAAKLYSAYGALRTHLDIPIAEPAPDPPAEYPEINENTTLTVSEWGVIRTLFLLYVERETAKQLEASRDSGIDPFGRASSEVSSDITQYEADMPRKCFFREVETI